MPTDNTATTWRDLADQLTDHQIEQLRDLERDGELGAALMLKIARAHVQSRLIDITYADVPVPPGAKVGQWEENTAGGWSRSLVWAEYGEPEMCVDIDGRQEHTGDYTRLISVYLAEHGASLTSLGARTLAGYLVEAADELDQLNAADVLDKV